MSNNKNLIIFGTALLTICAISVGITKVYNENKKEDQFKIIENVVKNKKDFDKIVNKYIIEEKNDINLYRMKNNEVLKYFVNNSNYYDMWQNNEERQYTLLDLTKRVNEYSEKNLNQLNKNYKDYSTVSMYYKIYKNKQRSSAQDDELDDLYEKITSKNNMVDNFTALVVNAVNNNKSYSIGGKTDYSYLIDGKNKGEMLYNGMISEVNKALQNKEFNFDNSKEVLKSNLSNDVAKMKKDLITETNKVKNEIEQEKQKVLKELEQEKSNYSEEDYKKVLDDVNKELNKVNIDLEKQIVLQEKNIQEYEKNTNALIDKDIENAQHLQNNGSGLGFAEYFLMYHLLTSSNNNTTVVNNYYNNNKKKDENNYTYGGSGASSNYSALYKNNYRLHVDHSFKNNFAKIHHIETSKMNSMHESLKTNGIKSLSLNKTSFNTHSFTNNVRAAVGKATATARASVHGGSHGSGHGGGGHGGGG